MDEKNVGAVFWQLAVNRPLTDVWPAIFLAEFDQEKVLLRGKFADILPPARKGRWKGIELMKIKVLQQGQKQNRRFLGLLSECKS